jgi:hypothetical protein
VASGFSRKISAGIGLPPNRPLKNPGLIANGKWEMANCQAFSMFHMRFAIQDAFFSILLKRPAGY